jgi:hypothetical protein
MILHNKFGWKLTIKSLDFTIITSNFFMMLVMIFLVKIFLVKFNT